MLLTEHNVPLILVMKRLPFLSERNGQEFCSLSECYFSEEKTNKGISFTLRASLNFNRKQKNCFIYFF